MRAAADAHHLRDADLSSEGERQLGQLVADATKLFAGVRAVFTSPLRRALRTAIPIAAALGAKLYIVPALREIRRDVSDIGSPGADLVKAFPKLVGLEKLPARWWRDECSACQDAQECDKCVKGRLDIVGEMAAENSGAIFVCHSDLALAMCGSNLKNGEYTTYDPTTKRDDATKDYRMD